MTNKDLRKHSKIMVDGMEQSPSRSMLRAVGFKDADFKKPQIGIASTWSNVTPCNMHIDKLALEAEKGANAGGGKAEAAERGGGEEARGGGEAEAAELGGGEETSSAIAAAMCNEASLNCCSSSAILARCWRSRGRAVARPSLRAATAAALHDEISKLCRSSRAAIVAAATAAAAAASSS